MKKILVFALLVFVTNTSFAQTLNPLVIGTLDPGDSIMVYYDVTINNGCGCSEIDNQGTVSGSNFATLNTDDPKTTAPNDVTITHLNLNVVALNTLQLSGKHLDGGITLSWTTATENNMISYDVERSADGTHFVKVGEKASVNSTTGYTYTYFDASPGSGINYYRLRLISSSAAAKYSTAIRINPKGATGGIEISPNPIVDRQLNIQLNDIPKGDYNFALYNSSGQTVLIKTIHYNSGSELNIITIPATLSSGIYNIRLQGTQQSYSKQILIQ